MKTKKQPKTAQAKPSIKVKDIPPKKNPKGGLISSDPDALL